MGQLVQQNGIREYAQNTEFLAEKTVPAIIQRKQNICVF